MRKRLTRKIGLQSCATFRSIDRGKRVTQTRIGRAYGFAFRSQHSKNSPLTSIIKVFIGNIQTNQHLCYTCHTANTRQGDPMLAVRIPNEIETRLDKLATLTGRPKSFYVREALQAHLDEIEDTYTALYRLEHPAKRWTLEELEKGLDLKK
jgi:RHH-type rel operon transcriptional repressor/antitoxin RelB